MTKISLFFISLLTILITGCSNDDYYERGSSDTKQSKTAHWYGVKQLSDSVSLRSAADRMKLWAQDPVITVKFLNSPDDPTVIDQIKTYAKEWEQYAGVTFNFVETSENALVRIGFDWDGNSWLTWSYTGNDAKMVRNQNEPTACFGGFSDGVMSDEEIKGDVLRVFGQILGLEFEQRHQGWDPSWWKKDKNGVYYAEKYWEGMFDGYYENLDWETIRQFVFDPLAGATIVQTADVDFESIMMWPYYTKKETVKLYANYELSDGDKEFIATLYPKKEGNTIQTAWVDAGYFVWVNAEKTQLRITEKGAQMEELPDVIDGEQLTSAREMFYYRDSEGNLVSTKLKKAPFFKTSNIRRFEYMFSYCTYLQDVPLYNTSKGESFKYMFYDCYFLETIPCFDTSRSRDFTGMFASCAYLINIPQLDTSRGEDFTYMFIGCTKLKTIPALNTSKGKSFNSMFTHASSLISIPLLDLSEGEDFKNMFYACPLESIPSFDLSNGHNFEGMFESASLKVVPSLNCSKGINFGGMFARCGYLESVSSIDVSNGLNFDGMFSDCPNLTVVPPLNTSKGESFGGMFAGCSSLKNIPYLDISNGTEIDGICDEIPNLETVNLYGFAKSATSCQFINKSSSLDVSSLEYMVENAGTPSYRAWIQVHKSLQSKVSADLIAQAAAKNIKFEFIY